MKNKGVLLVFAKSPEAGKVKTRLIPDIGVTAATNLYKELLTRTLNSAANFSYLDKQLWLSGNKEHSFFNSFNKTNVFKIMKQSGLNLGEKMFNAFNHALIEYAYAVLIGCDCPSLTIQDFKTAATMLETDKDIVLGPAEDGGYYLIALKKNYIELFSDIEWGADSVFLTTLTKAKELNLNIGLLTKRIDIDRVTDIPVFEEIKKQ